MFVVLSSWHHHCTVHPVEQHTATGDPLGTESACKLLSLPPTIYYYYSALKLILIFTAPQSIKEWADLDAAAKLCSLCLKLKLYTVFSHHNNQHSCPRWNSILGLHTPQKGTLSLWQWKTWIYDLLISTGVRYQIVFFTVDAAVNIIESFTTQSSSCKCKISCY